MPLQITIDTRGLRPPQEQLKVYAYRLRHMEPALFKGGKHMEKVIDRRWGAGGGASEFGGEYQRWAPNRPSTIKRKGHRRVLIGGGPHAGFAREHTRAVVRGNELKIRYPWYMEFHQQGFHIRKIHRRGKLSKSGKSVSGQTYARYAVPKRPFAYPTRGDLQVILNFITRYVLRGAT